MLDLVFLYLGFEVHNRANLKQTYCQSDAKWDEEKVDPTTFKQIVGSLRYMYNSRLDIYYAIDLISRFMEDPRDHI
jgi:hypothetical protein